MRALVPADTLVYLETNDLAAALQPIIDSKPFAEAAKSKPDLAALKGVQVAVAVTGFETTEEKLTDEHSVGRVRPRFVAVINTHLWDFQAVKFVEAGLDDLVQDMLGGDAKMGRSQKSRETGGTYITWASNKGLAHALVLDGLIYFGNDDSAIDKCLAVRRGEIDGIGKAGKLAPLAADTLASGYVSADGIAQIANIISLKLATDTRDDADLRTAIVAVIPERIRASLTEIAWTMKRTDQGIEDRYSLGVPTEARSDDVMTELAGSLAESIEEASADEIAESFGVEKTDADGLNKTHLQENRFTDAGLERRTVSDLGFIGWLVSQLTSDQE